MTWNQLSKAQQNTARKLSAELVAAGVEDATVSQVAKHFDQAMRWKRGQLALDQLAETTGWSLRRIEPVIEVGKAAQAEFESATEKAARSDIATAAEKAARTDFTPAVDKAAAELAEAVTTTIRDADTAIRDAIRAAQAAGVSANEIARRASYAATGVRGYSRSLVLEILGAEDILASAVTALREAEISVGGQYAEEVEAWAWRDASRRVLVRLSDEMMQRASATRYNLASGIEKAISQAGLMMSQGDYSLDMWQCIARGETAEISRS
ncbi:hypothetical protein ACIBG7_15310 [Nonomuraea sp. NPDC050328]|uniref:hypothetical protein n=1 Tax=Nonomuraea sp. NPDC050328 TaxID=3364361 RepID=UPI0037B1521F